MTTLIIAIDNKKGISKNGVIPWKFKLDSDYFFDVTTRHYEKKKNNVLIVGRKTYEQMTKMKLHNREFLVVSKTMTNSNDCHVAKNIDDAIEMSAMLEYGHIFVCGGKEIYREYLKRKLVNTVLITTINDDYKCDNIIDFDIIPKSFYHEDHKKFTIDNTELIFDSYTTQCYDLCKYPEDSYLNMLYDVIQNDYKRDTRNGKTLSTFGKTLTFNLKDGFPLLTTKSVFFKGIFWELWFFLNGFTDANILKQKGVNIWTSNTTREFLDKNNHKDYKEGDMGPMYGFNWLHYGAQYNGCDKKYEGYNQLAYCINLLKTDPDNRRILMTTFNPAQANEGVLYPCHGIHVQFYVEKGNRLSCFMSQRSADACCGIPFNIASYALLIHLMCNTINNSDSKYKYEPGNLMMTFVDTHIYEEHINNAMRQILRTPYDFPKIKINKKMANITDIDLDNIEIIKYTNYGPLVYKMIA